MSLAICKHHLIDLGYNPNSPRIPSQMKTKCEIEGCDNSAQFIVEEDETEDEGEVK
ncbi:MAG: hypothetical protein WC562_09620 [Dehalococcoidia bacterium]